MFAYNPQVQDRSGEILGNAGAASAEIRRQGNVAAAQAVSDAISNISSMYTKKQEQNKQDTAKLESSMAAGQAMMNLSQQYGPEGETFRQSLGDALNQAGNNPDKISGATLAHMSYFDTMMSKDKMNAQIAGYKDLASSKASLGGPGTNTTTTAAPKYNTGEARAFAAQAKAKGLNDDQIKEGLRNTLGPWAESAVYGNPNAGNFWGP